MEFLYIWIDSYKNINRQGFNFSPKYRFEFTPKIESNEVICGNLTCTENDFPDNFFGEGISNVTAIVGENGSGKSTLLEFLFKLNLDIFHKYEDKLKAIIVMNGKVYIHRDLLVDIKVNQLTLEIVSYPFLRDYSLSSFKSLRFLHYSAIP